MMLITRRRLIAATIGAPVALGQVDHNDFAAGSRSELRLERHGDPQRPAVALFRPGEEHPSAIIEMPEHAWRKEKPIDEPSWFYKMRGSDPTFRGEVTWFKSGSTLSYSMKTPSGLTLNSKASLEADGVAITHEVIDAASNLAVVEAPTCVKLYRPFTDVFLERTYVHHPEGLQLIASETPDRLVKNAEEWLPCRYIVLCGKNARRPEKLIERLDGVTRYFKSRAADVPFIATESQPGGWVAATHGIDCPSLFTNPARTCHHADPEAQSITDGKARLRLKVYMLKGTLKDAWELIENRDRSGDA